MILPKAFSVKKLPIAPLVAGDKKPVIPPNPPGKPKAPNASKPTLPASDLTNFFIGLVIDLTKLPNPYCCRACCALDIAIVLPKF